MSHEVRPPAGEPVRRLPAPSWREVLEGLTSELRDSGIDEARHEAERLMSHVLGISRSDLILGADSRIEPEQAGRMAAIARHRMSGVPLQHIEGTCAFRDLVLLCDGRALVPRPETEQLVQQVVEWSSSPEPGPGVRRVRRVGLAAPPARGTALDIGTGSGAIALSLVQEGVVSRAVGVDVSAAALEQARENAARAGLETRVDFRRVQDSPWRAIHADEAFDVIVSNPPYIPDGEIEALAPEVRDHDPRVALAGGTDGLDVLREIVEGAPAHVRPGGGLFLEVGHAQAGTVQELLERSAAWRRVRVVRDLSGRERFVVALWGEA